MSLKYLCHAFTELAVSKHRAIYLVNVHKLSKLCLKSIVIDKGVLEMLNLAHMAANWAFLVNFE